MINTLQHHMSIVPSRDEKSRQEFVSSLRGHILVNMATSMQHRYTDIVSPKFQITHGRLPKSGGEVHQEMKSDLYFKFYSSIRYNAQEMVWRSVIPMVDRNLDDMVSQAAGLRADQSAVQGSLTLQPDLPIPKNVSKVDVHLAPGSYHSEYVADDIAAGAIYDNGLSIFSANLMGQNLDDIGGSMANYIRLKYPDFHPEKILDCGCTIGHNSAPWAKIFPQSEVHAIDVSAPALRYGSARAQSQAVPIHFKQMNATCLAYDDNSFDVVFTSMFLHELPLKDIQAFFKEAYRVLKPGGLLLNMELPPNDQMAAYDSFYLDWDCFYNNEPFYKTFRDQSYPKLCTDAGFHKDNFLQLTTPQYGYMSEAEFITSIQQDSQIDDKTGRLTEGIQWFGFGAWKGENING
jgi:ubiquinone/menaquinone biosynthesis C-methylase UbiE